MVQAFEIIGNGHEKPAMQKLVLDIKAEHRGRQHAARVARRSIRCTSTTCSSTWSRPASRRARSRSLLDKIATYKEKTEALKKKIKKALFYPIAVLVVAVIVSIILLIFVIPQFEALFKGFGADLPAFTQMVINLSRFVQHQGWWMRARDRRRRLCVLLFPEALAARCSSLWTASLLKFPIIGPILIKAAIARYARTLSTMFAAGVPLVEAMESVAGATGNIVYEEAVLRMKDEVATGQRLQRAMENTGLFPNMVMQMIAVGEESGSLDTMSGKVAEFYEAEVDNAVDSMSSLLEPLIMAILGVLVGGMVIAMYLPIFKLGSVVG